MDKGATHNQKTGLVTAGLVLGIIGVVFSFIPIINIVAFILGILAIIFGGIGIAKKAGGKAIAALILGIASIGITIYMQQATVKVIDDAARETTKALDEASETLNKSMDDMSGKNTDEILGKDVEVTLGAFSAVTDEIGLTKTSLPVTVKNLMDESKSFQVQIEAVDGNGTRIDNDSTVYANYLAAGQTQQFEAFTLVTSDKVDQMKNATFRIVSISKY